MEPNRDRKPQVDNAVDPVCKKKIPEQMEALQTVYEDQTYRFCCPGCKREFDANPKSYATDSKEKKRGGLWSRYLNRLHKSTGGKPQCCH